MVLIHADYMSSEPLINPCYVMLSGSSIVAIILFTGVTGRIQENMWGYLGFEFFLFFSYILYILKF